MTTHFTDHFIASNPVQPRIKTRLAAKLRQLTPRLQKCPLRGIQSILTRTYAVLKTVHQPVLVPPHQIVKCLYSTPKGRRYQLLIRLLNHVI
jgi:hypothetical protein